VTALGQFARSGIDAFVRDWKEGRRGGHYAMLAPVWSAGSGLVMLVLALAFLTPAAQGYFFSFLSLLVAQLVVELGFALVLTQFVSHEWAHLRIAARGEIEGDAVARSRLRSLVRLALRWYAVLAGVLVVVLGAGGTAFFAARQGTDVDWLGPWLAISIAQGLAAPVVAIGAFIEGTDRVHVNQRKQLLANVVGGVGAWITLAAGGGLWALVVLVAARGLTAYVLLYPEIRPLVRLLHERGDGEQRVSWRAELWPLQWRVASIQLTGLVMMASFAPIAFQLRGPVVAGQVGAMAQAMIAVIAMGGAWALAARPRMGQLAARGEIPALIRLTRSVVLRGVVTAGVAASAGVAALTMLHEVSPRAADRIGTPLAAAFFLLAAVLLQVATGEASAVRFRKREPFLAVNSVTAVATISSSLVLGHLFGAAGIGAGFAAIVGLLFVPWTHRIFRREMRP
jgi:hypothetical protein